MRKSYLVVFMVCLSFLFVSAASAEMYGAVKVGYVMTTDSDLSGVETGTVEWDGGFGFGAALGTTMDQIRLEGELEFRTADVDETDADESLDTWSLLANGYYDFIVDSGFKPYIGAGIGFAMHDIDDEDDTVFAYQVTLGAAMAMSDTMDLDCAYRYFATADPDFGGVEADYGSHNISIGLRFKF